MGILKLLKIVLAILALVLVLVAGLLLFVPGLHTSSLEMILNVMTGAGSNRPEAELLQRLRAADGYRVSVFARGIANPRMLHRSSTGRVLISSPRSGEILQFTDADGDGIAEAYQQLLSGLQRPHGLDVHKGYLYVAESNQVGRIAYDVTSGEVSGDYQVVVGDLTDNGNHWTKTLRIDPAGRLYVAMGSTCNVCEEADQRRATIMRYEPDGSSGKIYASGLRNSVGMAFAPWDGGLYATDNGRDLLGDDYPPCELNHIVEDGFYGWPYLNGDNELDPDFGAGRESLQDTAIKPVFNFPAHNAPLGIHFSDGPERQALVALHGSWNRSTPDGYRVLRLSWQPDGSIESEDFLWGFEEDGDIVGRPVDIVGDGDGGYFISDDFARVIYWVSKRERESVTALEVRAAAPEAGGLDAGLAAAGADLYQAMPCGDCHDANALTPVSLAGVSTKYNVDSLTEYFLTPTPPMPRYELSLEQRRQLAHYLLSRD